MKISRMNWRQITLIAMYLGAIIPANLVIANFGSIAVLPVAFLFIGLDLTSRDYLHEIWEKRLWLKMLGLISFGSLISWLINRNAEQVAIASLLAFLCAGLVDTIAYHLLGKRTFMVRMNGSNLFSSFVDSTVFLTIAFGVFMPVLILAQFGTKVAGGFMWSVLLKKLR